jgi:hypothetical protein
MAKLIKIFAFSTLLLSLQTAYADDTIYTWTDEQESLTNYGGIPPDEELSSDAVKVINLQKGITTKLDFPTRNVDELVEKNRQLAKSSAGSQTESTATSTPKILSSSTPVAPTPSTETAKPASQPGMLASGKVNSFIDSEEAKKLSEQEAKLEEQAKSARRIAIDKRKEEMKALAERVRNGAASRQEIAALMTYRQTASFGEARGALARPKTAKKVQLSD